MGVEPFNAIVHHCASNSDTDGVMETFQALQQQAARGITTDKYTYSGVLRGLMEAKMYGMALELYAQVIKQGIQPDAMLYCQWITCCAYTSRPKDVCCFWGGGREGGWLGMLECVWWGSGGRDCVFCACGALHGVLHPHIPTTHTNHSNPHSTHTNTQAELLFGKMQGDGIKPNTHTYNALLNVYAEVGDAPRAQDVYVQMTSTPG